MLIDSQSGSFVDGLGDVNGDGVNDFLVSASRADASYVIFGQSPLLPEPGPLAPLLGAYQLTGFTITLATGDAFSQDDVEDFSGHLTIQNDGTGTQEIIINDQVDRTAFNIEVIDDQTVRMIRPDCTADLTYDLSNNALTTMANFGACDVAFVSESYTWERVVP